MFYFLYLYAEETNNSSSTQGKRTNNKVWCWNGYYVSAKHSTLI